MIGEVAVRSPVGLDEIEAEAGEQGADHRPGHPVAAVDDDPQRAHGIGVDERQRGGLELVVDIDLLGAPAARRLAQPAGQLVPDVADAGVSGEGDRPAAHELGPGVALGVVRGGAHQTAVELTRADEVIEHLGADLAGVENVSALGLHPGPVALGQLGSAQAHVAAEAEAQLAERLVLEL